MDFVYKRGMATYTVKRGDTLFSLARRFRTTVDALARVNRIANPNRIFVGQRLQLPAGSALPPPAGPPRPAPRPPAPRPPAPAVALPRALFGSRARDPALLALVPSFHRWADHYRVPRDLLKAIAYVESAWRADAVSPTGAIGIGQLLPSTAAWINQDLLGGTRLNPRRADDNIRLSSRLVRYLRDNTSTDADAVAAYLQGLGSLRRDGPRRETQVYVWKVLTTRVHFR